MLQLSFKGDSPLLMALQILFSPFNECLGLLQPHHPHQEVCFSHGKQGLRRKSGLNGF
jgi:hypothetical protein